MAKKRKAVSDAVKDKVLNEYRHRCAICGHDNPQLHHIDENPENNDPMNLIPLCANHHLSNQHCPTTRIPTFFLHLFRRFKDPAILTPQFNVLFDRFHFAYTPPKYAADSPEDMADELVEFVACLEMGKYYSKKIRQLLDEPLFLSTLRTSGGCAEHETENDPMVVDYDSPFSLHRDKIICLLVELLKFQEWRYREN